MNEEDFACDTFAPQKWRKDTCRNCFQPLRLHTKKQQKMTGDKKSSEAANADPIPKPEAKVFRRYQHQKDTGIDTSVPARERTQPQQLEGIQHGTVQKVLELAPTLKVDAKKFEERMRQANPSYRASSQADSDTASAQAGSDTASPQGDSNTASAQAGSDTASPQGDSNTASPQADSNTASPQADSNTASPQADSNTASPQGDSNTASPQADSNTASPQADSNTASPQADSNTASPQADSNIASPQADSNTASQPTATAELTESSQDQNICQSLPKSQESVVSQLSDHANANTQEQEENGDSGTQDDRESVKQTITRVKDDDHDMIDSGEQDLEVKNSQAPEIGAELRENKMAKQQGEKQSPSNDTPQEEDVTEPQEKKGETAAGEQDEEEKQPMKEAATEPKEEEGEEEEVVVVSYSSIQPEGDRPSGEDVVVDNHLGGQLREDDEEPRSKLDGEASASDKVELECVQEEEGEVPELATAAGEGDGCQRLEAEEPAVASSDSAAMLNTASEVTSGDIPIPPLPPLPPGVPHPPPPPPGVEVQESGPYPRPKPRYVPNDDSIPSPPLPPLPPGVPPPPPPPPLAPPPDNQQPRPKPPQQDQLPELLTAHQAAMMSIRRGVSLRAAPPPSERSVQEEKVVDVASEMRQRVRKQRKQETDSITSRLSEHQEEIRRMADVLHSSQGTPSFLHHLRTLLAQVEDFLRKVEIPAEILARKMEWPAYLVDDLREVLQYMGTLEGKVEATENLCKKTIENSVQVSAGGVQVWRVNPDDVERCVWDVVRVAKELHSDESRYFRASQSYPLDGSAIQVLLQRAADAVSPLLDKLYEKAFQSYQSVFDPAVTKYDLTFRLKNTQRLLALCCKISDALSMYLQVPKHALYSEAQLKSRELMEEFQKEMNVIKRQGTWDVEESFELQKPFTKKASSSELKEVELASHVMEVVTAGNSKDAERALADVTEQLFPRIEVQLIKAAVASGNMEVIDCVMALRNRCCTEEEAQHKHNFDWLLEATTKKSQECVKHLVQNHSIPINCQSRSAAHSVLHRSAQRQDLSMLTFLIRLGGNPILLNTAERTPLQLLAINCFPPHPFVAKEEENREPLFDLFSYIDNPSLSDVVLISEDGQRFFAHRLVMCAQSPVLKTMLDSELWAESKNKEVPLPTINSRAVRILLQYLYTGRCLFTHDDLNLGLDLLATADRFLLEPMRLQCERALSEKIDAEVVIPLYYAAFRYSATKLLANCSNFLLNHYDKVDDPDYEALLHLLDNPEQR